MLTLKIDIDKYNTMEFVDYLNYIATQLEKGFTSGEGWDMTGTSEDEGDEE